MRFKLIILILLFSSFTVFGKDTVCEHYSKSIKAEDLKKHLQIIAGAEFEGRETGEKGQKLAASYLVNDYLLKGLLPGVLDTFIQSYPISQESILEPVFISEKVSFTFFEDYYFYPRFKSSEFESSEIIFAGYGINDSVYNDYRLIDVKYKIVVIFSGEPLNDKGIYLLSGTHTPSSWNNNWRLKAEVAKKAGANALIIIDEKFEENKIKNKHAIYKPLTYLADNETPDNRIPCLFVSPSRTEALLNKSNWNKIKSNIDNIGKPQSLKLKNKIILKLNRDKQFLQSENVIAIIPGTDKKNEYVVFSAHYDHLGKHENKIYYGADDDGSGTVSILELAEAFQLAAKAGYSPRRTLVFINFSGEEKGLLGSEYYSRHPVFPLEQTVADFNIDMIGRLDNKHQSNPNYCYLIGSDKLSDDLHQISEAANSMYTQLEIDYTYNHPGDPNRFYYRSDHYNFAKNNVPVIFYFTGVHEDYHQPGDTVDKIDFNKMEKIVRLVFTTAWEVANRDERLKINKTNEFKNNR